MDVPPLGPPDLTRNSAASEPGADDLERVRELLLGGEKRQIAVIEHRLENPELRAEDVSRVLSRSVALAAARDDHLNRAFAPVVEAALHESAERNPGVLARAIFPVMGPAIRKAVAEMFGRLVESVNQALEHSLSWQGLRWRVEAWRTGRSFAELVLARTLVFRVERVFLIHRHAGLLLQDVHAAAVAAPDSDLVSGMLRAIQDFVEDSFRVRPGETIQTLQVGELTVWIETGTQALLAAVVRGQAPLSFRETLQRTLERIHQEMETALAGFQGDNAPFAAIRPYLDDCLQAQFRERRGRRRWPVLIVTGLVTAAAAVGTFTAIRDNRRWTNYLERIQAEEGIVVTATARQGGRHFVSGWRDPLAVDPATLLGAYRLSADEVAARWEPYHGLSRGLVLRRAAQRLAPPPGVALSLENGVLSARGVTAAAWTAEARRIAPTVPGVETFDTTQLADTPVPAFPSRDIERLALQFGEAAELAPGQDEVLAQLVSRLQELRHAAEAGRNRVQVGVVGHTDKTGTEDFNRRLSRQRAEAVVSLLVSRGLPADLFALEGRGAEEPRRPGMSPAEEILNRRVTFEVRTNPAPGLNAPP